MAGGALQPGWRLALYPEAAEAGGSFRGLSREGRGGLYEVDPERSVNEATMRAKRKVRRYCAANGLNRLGTLTYRGEGCHESGELRRDLSRFWRRLRAGVGEVLPYLWVPEWHSGGHGLHAHFAVGRFVSRSH